MVGCAGFDDTVFQCNYRVIFKRDGPAVGPIGVFLGCRIAVFIVRKRANGIGLIIFKDTLGKDRRASFGGVNRPAVTVDLCLLYTSDAADE